MPKILSDDDREMYLSALKTELSSGVAQTGFDYKILAWLFPSQYPHPETFEYNLINQDQLEDFLKIFGYKLQETIEGSFPNRSVIFHKI